MRLINPKYNFFSREYWFGQIDTRPLSVFRIVFGLVLLKDAIYHFFIARWFYSDTGIVPRHALTDLVRDYRFTVMDAMPFTWMAHLVFALWTLVLILLILGWRTRLMAVLNFLLVMSIHERNIYVLNGADTVIRVMSFWSIFLPWGQYYSLDAVRGRFARFLRSRDLADLRAGDGPRTGYAFPLRVIQIQFAMIYLFTALLKTGDAWRQGDAIYYALQLKSLTLPTGDFLVANAPLWLLRGMTYQSLITEWVFFFFVFLPFGQPALRIAALVLGTMLHVGIGVTMSIGNFSNVMIASYLLFFEPEWITWIGAKLRRVRLPSALPLPAGANPLWALLAATTPREVGVDESHALTAGSPDDWWILDENGDRLSGEAAWLRALGHLPMSRLWAWLFRFRVLRVLAWPLLRAAVARSVPAMPDSIGAPEVAEAETLRDPLLPVEWRLAAAVGVTLLTAALAAWAIIDGRSIPPEQWSTRDWLWWGTFSFLPALMVGWGAYNLFGWLSPSRSTGARGLRAFGRTVLTMFQMLLLSTIIWWNLTTIGEAQGGPIIDSVPQTPRRIVQQLSLWQAWDMFSPYPSTVDGWVVIPGKFEDGRTFDLNTGEPVSTEFRRWFAGPGERWKKYESNISRDEHTDLLSAWGGYWCDEYNTRMKLPEGQRLATLEIHYYSYRSHAPGEPPNEMRDVTLWRHWCYPEYEY